MSRYNRSVRGGEAFLTVVRQVDEVIYGLKDVIAPDRVEAHGPWRHVGRERAYLRRQPPRPFHERFGPTAVPLDADRQRDRTGHR